MSDWKELTQWMYADVRTDRGFWYAHPLHEIDGGWFWWTDKKKPENTAALWRLMYDHFTRTRKLDNLIWVYSAGVGKGDAEYRKRF